MINSIIDKNHSEAIKRQIKLLSDYQLLLLHKRLYSKIKYKGERLFWIEQGIICPICQQRLCTDTHHLVRREKGDCRNNYRMNLYPCCNRCHIDIIENDRRYKYKKYDFEIWEMEEYYNEILEILDEIE